uniref:IS1 family transposase n=1 Tax=Escherichia coli TaxID=562 RepID=UPI001FCEF1EC
AAPGTAGTEVAVVLKIGGAAQHLARLGRKSLSFSKSVELHDKVIGHYLNIKHYQ